MDLDRALERWYAAVRGELALEDVLARDCSFHSPVVFRPAIGRDATAMYLRAAETVFGIEPGHDPWTAEEGFRYVGVAASGDRAVLEFEVDVGGTWVNGVDIVTFDDEGRIREFKVMLRPHRAVTAMRDAMTALLVGE